MKKIALLLAVALLFTALAPAMADAGSGVLNLYTTTKITTLNPFENGDTDAREVINGVLLHLYTNAPSADGEGFYMLDELALGDPAALNVEHTQWEIRLRDNAKWQDGTPVTAQDVVYSAKMCLDPQLLTRQAASYANNYIIISNAEKYYLQGSSGESISWDTVGLQAKDDHTLLLTVDAYCTVSDIKQHFSTKWCALVNPTLFEACMSEDRKSNTYGTSLDTFMSCGQFILTDYQPGVSLTMTRNTDYVHDELTRMAGWTLTTVADANTALELFLAGQMDTSALSSSAKEQYEEDPRVWIAPAESTQCMIVNFGNTNQNAILGNLNFRKALFYGCDRVSIAKLVKGIPANYVLGQKCLANPDTGENFRALESSAAYLAPNNGYDPDLAREYFAKALAETGLSEVTVSLLYSESSGNNKRVAEYLHTALPALFGESFHVQLEAQSSSVAKSMRKAWAKKGGDPNSYELTFTGWTTTAVAPWNAMKVYCGWYSNKNEPYFSDAYDALWEKANNSREAKDDSAYRISLTQELERMILDDVVTIPLYEVPSYRLISDRVHLAVNHYVEGIGYAWLYAEVND